MATCVSCGLAGAPAGWDGLCPKCKRLAEADATLKPFALPRMATPWKTVVVSVAVFGFVWGYVGTAGSADTGLPLAFGGRCASMGQCLQYTLDRGFPGFFYPAALVPGAGSALILGAVAYLLFLIVYGIRKAFHWQPAVRGEKQSALTEGLPSVASRSEEKQSALTQGLPLAASRSGEKQSARPYLLLAVGVALAWGILSVGPSRLASDLDQLVPHDTVTAAFCAMGRVPSGDGCSNPAFDGYDLPDLQKTTQGTADLTKLQCVGWGLGVPGPEPDGMCHERSGGYPNPLVGDVLLGGENALLAFLAIGAALLLWPRLRAAMQESSPSRAALRTPTLDLGTSDQPAVGPGENVSDKLRQLAALRDDGIISSEEFEAKKAELLRAF